MGQISNNYACIGIKNLFAILAYLSFLPFSCSAPFVYCRYINAYNGEMKVGNIPFCLASQLQQYNSFNEIHVLIWLTVKFYKK